MEFYKFIKFAIISKIPHVCVQNSSQYYFYLYNNIVHNLFIVYQHFPIYDLCHFLISIQ